MLFLRTGSLEANPCKGTTVFINSGLVDIDKKAALCRESADRMIPLPV